MTNKLIELLSSPFFFLSFLFITATLHHFFCYLKRASVVSKAIKSGKFNHNDLKEALSQISPGGAVLRNALSDPSALLAFGLLFMIGLTYLSGKDIPEVFSYGFFLAAGLFFGQGRKKSSKKNNNLKDTKRD